MLISKPQPHLPRALVVLGLLVVLAMVSGLLAAQRATPPTLEVLEEGSYSMRHQPAADAMTLLRNQLSAHGRVELAADNRTIRVIDTPRRVSAMLHLLRELDHPAREIEIEIQILEASRRMSGPSGDPRHPSAELAQRLGKLLNYNEYRVLADASFLTREGQTESYRLGSGYQILFDVGTVMPNQRLRLAGFKVLGGPGEVDTPRQRSGNLEQKEEPLFHSHVNLWLDRTVALGFAQDAEAETALVIAVTCRAAAGARGGR